MECGESGGGFVQEANRRWCGKVEKLRIRYRLSPVRLCCLDGEAAPTSSQQNGSNSAAAAGVRCFCSVAGEFLNSNSAKKCCFKSLYPLQNLENQIAKN